jgi:hypothetical protein
VSWKKEDAKEGKKPKDTPKTLMSYERKQNPIGR